MRNRTHISRVITLTLSATLTLLTIAPFMPKALAGSSKVQPRTATTTDIAISGPGELVAADFNGDNYPDLVVNQSDSSNRYISIELSNGAGGYLPPNQIPVETVSGTSPSYRVFAKDFNNDSKIDIAIVLFGIGGALGGTLPTSIKFYQGDGNGNFAAPVTSSPVGGSYSDFLTNATVGNLNGDGKLDFIFCAWGPGFSSPPGDAAWSYGNGTGGFADGGSMSVNDAAVGVAAGDFNNDSKLDVVVQSQGGSCGSGVCLPAFQSLIGDGTGNFTKNTFASIGASNLVVGDFNNDSKLDVFSRNGILLGDGLGGFNRSTTLPGSGTTDPSSGSSTAVGDFNHDGKLDAAMILDGNQIGFYFGNGAGGLSATHYFTPGLQPAGLAAADFNHNGNTDLAVSLFGENKVRIYFDDVLPNLANSHVYDFDGDGKTDIAVYRPGSPGMWFYLRSSDGTFQQFAFGTAGDIPVSADYNGDGITELAVFRPSNAGWYISNYPNPGFTSSGYGLPTDTVIVGGDYDGNGRADLAVYRVSGGAGTFYISSIGAVGFGIATDKPVVGDFDGDGKTDVAVYRAGATTSDPSYWYILRSSDHAFMAVPFGVGGDKPVPADFDGDHVTNIAVFRPSTGYWYTSLDPATNYGGRQWGQSGDVPMAGDFDGDGKIDLSVYRGGVWYLLNSTNSAVVSYYFGVSSDKPVPATSLP